MWRMILRIASVVSLICFLASIALWTRSYFATDLVAYSSKSDLVSVRGFVSSSGDLLVAWVDNLPRSYGQNDDFHIESDPPRELTAFGDQEVFAPLKRVGIRASTYSNRLGINTGWDLIFPWWFITIATAVLPAWRIVQHRRQRRHKAGTCRACGYDLRATPDRCPECGAALATKS